MLDNSLKVVFLLLIGILIGWLIAGQTISTDMKICAQQYEKVRNAYIECEITKGTEVWYNVSNRFGINWTSNTGD